MKIRIVSYNPFSKLISMYSCNKTIEIASDFIPFQRMLQKHTYCFHQLQLQESFFHLSSIVQQMVLGLQKMPFLSCFAVQDLNRNASRPCLVSLVDLNIRNLISMVSYWFLELVDIFEIGYLYKISAHNTYIVLSKLLLLHFVCLLSEHQYKLDAQLDILKFFRRAFHWGNIWVFRCSSSCHYLCPQYLR